MLEAAFFDFNRIPGDSLYGRLHGTAVEFGHAHTLFCDYCDFAVIEKENVACVFENGGNIRGHETFVVAEAYHDRWTLPGRNDRVGLVGKASRVRKCP